MKYNTELSPLIIPEYGRHIHTMANSLLDIKNDQKRNKQAQVLINIMGNLNTHIPILMPNVKEPCVTQTSKLIISSVSNWGGYGLITALSMKSNKNLLPSVNDETNRINKSVELGAVDGFSKMNINKVDSFTIEENINKLKKLHQLLKTLKIPN